MVELVKSFDQLHNTAKKHSHDVEVTIDTHNYDNEMEFQEYVKTTRGRMSQLLDQVNSVKTYQTKVLKSLSKLIHYIHADSGEFCTNKLPNKCELLIDSYLLRDKCTSEIGDALVEMLQDENSRLRERNTLYREHALLVNKRAELVSAERDRFRKELDALRFGEASPNTSDFELICTDDHFASSANKRANTSDIIMAPTCTNNSSDETDKMADNKIILDLQKSYREVQERIIELDKSLESTQQLLQEEEELLKSVCVANVYHVDIMRTGDTKMGFYEEKILALLKNRNIECHVVKEFSLRTEDRNNVVLIMCCGYSDASWDKVLTKAEQIFPENNTVAIVMMYDNESRIYRTYCEDAQVRRSEFLSKSTVFTVRYNYKYQNHFYDKEEDPIVEFIHDHSISKRKVIGCNICAKLFVKDRLT
ncbi:hypothetical protein ACF0H5_002370 [Mactra antiquata]